MSYLKLVEVPLTDLPFISKIFQYLLDSQKHPDFISQHRRQTGRKSRLCLLLEQVRVIEVIVLGNEDGRSNSLKRVCRGRFK